jgi:hypothetical protein
MASLVFHFSQFRHLHLHLVIPCICYQNNSERSGEDGDAIEAWVITSSRSIYIDLAGHFSSS